MGAIQFDSGSPSPGCCNEPVSEPSSCFISFMVPSCEARVNHVVLKRVSDTSGESRTTAQPAEHRPASLRRPSALVPGDRVAVLTISSPAKQDALSAGLDALRFAGLEPVVYPSARDTGSF